jgi:hypothetical protein
MEARRTGNDTYYHRGGFGWSHSHVYQWQCDSPCINGVPNLSLLLGDADGESCLLYRYGSDPLDDLRLSALFLYWIGCGSNCVGSLVDASFCVSYFCELHS